MSTSEYSVESEDMESVGGQYPSGAHQSGLSVTSGVAGGVNSRMKKKRDSQGSFASETMESEMDYRDLESNLDVIDEYYYGVRVFPGQDPSQVSVTDILDGSCGDILSVISLEFV